MSDNLKPFVLEVSHDPDKHAAFNSDAATANQMMQDADLDDDDIAVLKSHDEDLLKEKIDNEPLNLMVFFNH